MNRYKPKYKICHQLNENIWGNPKIFKFKSQKWEFLKKRSNITKSSQFVHDIVKIHSFPRPLKTNFKNNLLAKQRLKKYYGKLTESQIRRLIRLSRKQQKVTDSITTSTTILINILERRLETVVFRMNFALSIDHARQLVSHGHILVNDKVIKRSILVKNLDKISIKKNQRNLIAIILKSRKQINKIPKYLEVNLNILSGIFVGPTVLLKNIPYTVWMDFNKVFSFYKK
jgi:small subunit ribosomal protein S4